MSKILRRRQVCDLTGLSYSTIYRLEREGEFPQRRRLGPNTVGWLASEVETWVERLGAVPSDDSTFSEEG